MNTKQIAEKAAERLRRLANDEFDWRDIQGTIQSAIEKATEPLYKLLDEQSARNWGIEQLRAERDHYKMLTQELGQELRAAHASELPANPDKDHPERLAPARETS